MTTVFAKLIKNIMKTVMLLTYFSVTFILGAGRSARQTPNSVRTPVTPSESTTSVLAGLFTVTCSR